MWILECDGEALSGRKLWLKPGSEYVVGRSVNAIVNLVIPQKSISRVHLKIRVGEVPKGNGFKVLNRSPVTVEGQETMYGTKVDGEPLGNEEIKILNGTEHILQLAKYEPNFTIRWQPIIFSFSLSTREKKDKKIMAQRQFKVEKFDMKTLEAFVPTTTHVVASKRNTAIGLQALVNGRYIVTEEYLNAVDKMCQPSDSGRSLLEEDFEKNWPDPMDYVPAPGNEPNPREKEYFTPKKERQNTFEGWTILFCENVQYENFLGPITDGGGKLERYDLIPGETTARKLVDFIEKRDTGNLAVVRFRGKGDTEDFCARLSTEVSEILNLRMVEQNEFLDIILTGDTSQLRRPLEEEATSAVLPPTATCGTNNIAFEGNKMDPPLLPNKGSLGTVDEDITMEEASEAAFAKPEASQPTRSRRLGRFSKTQPKFEMHDLFTMPGDPLPPPASSQFVPWSSIPETQYDAATPMTQTVVTQTTMGKDHSIAATNTQNVAYATGPETQTRTSTAVMSQSFRKRTAEPEDEDPDFMNKLFPGAAAMKKRRIQEEEEESARRAEHPEEDIINTETPLSESAKGEAGTQGKSGTKSQTKGKKAKAENPILTAAREVKEEEEKKKREAEDTKGVDDEEAILNLKSPGEVEVIEIKPRIIAMRVNAYGEESDRWDSRWNGRPNFKKFKKRLPSGAEDGSGGLISVRGNVIIPLVEHKSGSGSAFAHGFPGDSQPQTRADGEPEPEDNELEEVSSLAFSSRNNRTQPRGSQVQLVHSKSLSSQTLSAGSSDTIEGDGIRTGRFAAANKRPLSQSSTPKGPAEKRAKKFLLTREDSESSDEDGLKFTFRKRGK